MVPLGSAPSSVAEEARPDVHVHNKRLIPPNGCLSGKYFELIRLNVIMIT